MTLTHEPTPPFLEVRLLLEASVPRQRLSPMGILGGGFVLIVVASILARSLTGIGGDLVQVALALLLIGLIAGFAMLAVAAVRKHQAEQQAIEGAGELVQLRRWPEAAVLLQGILSRPARTVNLRTQALVYLSAVLSRYHRFSDAIIVQEHILDHGLVDESTAHALRFGRVMAMLREDHLFDADRALSELRRTGPGRESAAVTLAEMYRDVKTGHPTEAIDLFETRLPILRDQLGHRAADAYALAARAYDLLGRGLEAQNAYTKATLLAPPIEVHRRYPELSPLIEKYTPAPAPPEAM